MAKNSCEKFPKCLENKVSQKMCSEIDIFLEILYNGLIKLWAHPRDSTISSPSHQVANSCPKFFPLERFIVSKLESKEPRYLVSDRSNGL